MRHAFVSRIRDWSAFGTALVILSAGPVLAQQGKVATGKARPKHEVVSGVILRVEKQAEPSSKAGEKPERTRLRLSINSNAVWRDWVRDQVQFKDQGPPKKDAAKGAKSVATTGQPAEANNVVVVDVTTSTRIETRFRAPDDETTKGEKRPETVKPEHGTPPKRRDGHNPVQFRAEDLAPGLFVQAEFHAATAGKGEPATSVTVIRPIEVPEVPPATNSSK